jgi:hypothetical protein
MKAHNHPVIFRRFPVEQSIGPDAEGNRLKVWQVFENQVGNINTSKRNGFLEFDCPDEASADKAVRKKSRYELNEEIVDAIAEGLSALQRHAENRPARGTSYQTQFETEIDGGYVATVKLPPDNPTAHVYSLRHSKGGHCTIGSLSEIQGFVRSIDLTVRGV